jgi:hypothetical protein
MVRDNASFISAACRNRLACQIKRLFINHLFNAKSKSVAELQFCCIGSEAGSE